MDAILWQWPWELSQKLTNFPKLWNVQPLCGSRKYPYLPFPPYGRSLEIPRWSGEEGFKGSNFWGVGWFMGNLFFQRVTNHAYKTLKATYDWSEAQKHTYLRCFETKVRTPGHWDEVNIIFFTVSVFSLSKLPLQSREERCVFGAKSKRFLKMADITGVLSPDFQLRRIFVQPTFRCFHFSSLSITFRYTFTCRKHIFDRFHVLSVFIGGSNS